MREKLDVSIVEAEELEQRLEASSGAVAAQDGAVVAGRRLSEALKDAKALGLSSAEFERQRAKGERTIRTLEGIFERKRLARLN